MNNGMAWLNTAGQRTVFVLIDAKDLSAYICMFELACLIMNSKDLVFPLQLVGALLTWSSAACLFVTFKNHSYTNDDLGFLSDPVASTCVLQCLGGP